MKDDQVVINKRIKTALVYFIQDYIDDVCFYSVFITQGGKGDFIFENNKIARFKSKEDVRRVLRENDITESYLAIRNDNHDANIIDPKDLYKWSTFSLA